MKDTLHTPIFADRDQHFEGQLQSFACKVLGDNGRVGWMIHPLLFTNKTTVSLDESRLRNVPDSARSPYRMHLCVRVLPILVLEGSIARPNPQKQPSPLPQHGYYPIHLFECPEQNLHGSSIPRNPGPAHEDSMYLLGTAREGGGGGVVVSTGRRGIGKRSEVLGWQA
jgi:hypothetical protein